MVRVVAVDCSPCTFAQSLKDSAQSVSIFPFIFLSYMRVLCISTFQNNESNQLSTSLYPLHSAADALSLADAGSGGPVAADAFPSGFLVRCDDGGALCGTLFGEDPILSANVCGASARQSGYAVGRGAAPLSAGAGVYALCVRGAGGGATPAALPVRVLAKPLRIGHQVVSDNVVLVYPYDGDMGSRRENYVACLFPPNFPCSAVSAGGLGMAISCAESRTPNAMSLEVRLESTNGADALSLCLIASRWTFWGKSYLWATDGTARGVMCFLPTLWGMRAFFIVLFFIGATTLLFVLWYAFLPVRVVAPPRLRAWEAKAATNPLRRGAGGGPALLSDVDALNGAEAAEPEAEPEVEPEAEAEGGNESDASLADADDFAVRRLACMRTRYPGVVHYSFAYSNHSRGSDDSDGDGGSDALFVRRPPLRRPVRLRGVDELRAGDTMIVAGRKVAILASPLFGTVRMPRDADWFLSLPLAKLEKSFEAYIAMRNDAVCDGDGFLPHSDVVLGMKRDLEELQGSPIDEFVWIRGADCFSVYFQYSVMCLPSTYYSLRLWSSVARRVQSVFCLREGDLSLPALYAQFLSDAQCAYERTGRRFARDDVRAELRAVLELWQGSPLTLVDWSDAADTYFFIFTFSAVGFHRYFFYPRTDIPPWAYRTSMDLSIRSGRMYYTG